MGERPGGHGSVAPSPLVGEGWGGGYSEIFTQPETPTRHSGTPRSGAPGIYTPQLWLWIPGSAFGRPGTTHHSAASARRPRWSKRRSKMFSAMRFFKISTEPPAII